MARPRKAPRRRGPPLLALILACAALAILAASRGGDARLYPPKVGQPRTTIYLVDNGLHSDLALPRAALTRGAPIGRAAAMTTGAPWVMIGWGDARFYEETGISPARVADGLRALFWPRNPAVVHLEGLTSQPNMAFVHADTRAIDVSDVGLERMIARIDRSLAVDAGGAPVRDPTVTGPDEAFFRSAERFSLLHMCNHWTAEVLNAAGLPVNLALATLPAGLRIDLALRARISGASVPGTEPPHGARRGRARSTG